MSTQEAVIADEVIGYLIDALAQGNRGLSGFPTILKTVISEHLWKSRVVRQTGEIAQFERFEQFVAAAPMAGLGADMATIRRLCRDDAEALDLIQQAVQSCPQQGRRTDFVDIINEVERPTGTSAEQALRRLRKDAPELHAKVIAGELKPHAAMVEAGFRKRTIQIPSEPTKAAAALRRHFTPDELHAIVSELADMVEWRG